MKGALITSLLVVVSLAAACDSSDTGPPSEARTPTSIAATALASPDSDVRFVPTVSAVGGTISVQGYNWTPGPISIFLVPESERTRLDSGDASVLYLLGESTALSSGMFGANVLIPAELTPEGGASGTMSTAPGRYLVAAKGANGLRVGVAILTVR
jgi:hypothetical protein